MKQPNAHTPKNVFRCDVCDKEFKQMNLLKKHLARHEQEAGWKGESRKCFFCFFFFEELVIIPPHSHLPYRPFNVKIFFQTMMDAVKFVIKNFQQQPVYAFT